MAEHVLHDRVRAATPLGRSSLEPGKIRNPPCHDAANVSRPSVCCANRNPSQNHSFQSGNGQHPLHRIATATRLPRCSNAAQESATTLLISVVRKVYRASNDCVLVHGMWTQYAAMKHAIAVNTSICRTSALALTY